jgi:alpha-1,3-glucosyltransferase
VQVLSRLLPFARGLCHAYWAPNAWALYSFTDKMAAAAGAKAGLLQPAAAANMAGGIVGVSSYVVLPNVGAGTCALLVLLAIAPCLVACWKAPRHQAVAMLAPAIAYANLCGFMFGYHVHEKAALTVEIPMALVAVRSSDWGQLYVLFSTAAHVGIFPLLFQTQEIPIRWFLAVVYYIISVWGLSSIHCQQQGQGQAAGAMALKQGASATPQKQLQAGAGASGTPSPVGMRTRRQLAQKQQGAGQQAPPTTPVKAADMRSYGVQSMHQCCSWLPLLYRVYLAGFVLLELYCALGHRALLWDRLPFVPLMLTSVYCAVGATWTWTRMAWWFLQRC